MCGICGTYGGETDESRLKSMTDALAHRGPDRDGFYTAKGVGLAAPQIGVLLRVVIFGVSANPRYPDVEEVPYTVLINPEITPVAAPTAMMSAISPAVIEASSRRPPRSRRRRRRSASVSRPGVA